MTNLIKVTVLCLWITNYTFGQQTNPGTNTNGGTTGTGTSNTGTSGTGTSTGTNTNTGAGTGTGTSAGTGTGTGTGTTPLTCLTNEVQANRGYDCATCNAPNTSCSLTVGTKCYCNVGYVRNYQGRCILPEDCINSCQQNETASNMGFDCNTCSNYGKLICPIIRETRCYCKSGFVRNQTGFCIDSQDCPLLQQNQCIANQTFGNMGYDCQTCANYRQTIVCSLSNISKCYCNPGFVKDEILSKCVLVEDCSPMQIGSCTSNETFAEFGFDCATCTNYRYAQCTTVSQFKCYCKPGYVRNSANICISTIDCPAATLSNERCRNPESIGCRRGCVKTCANRNYYSYRPCSPVCRECDCPRGQVRHDTTGMCVSVLECPANSYTFPFYANTYNGYSYTT